MSKRKCRYGYPVHQYDKSGKWIKFYESIEIASKENFFSRPELVRATRTQFAKAYGFVWRVGGIEYSNKNLNKIGIMECCKIINE